MKRRHEDSGSNESSVDIVKSPPLSATEFSEMLGNSAAIGAVSPSISVSGITSVTTPNVDLSSIDVEAGSIISLIITEPVIRDAIKNLDNLCKNYYETYVPSTIENDLAVVRETYINVIGITQSFVTLGIAVSHNNEAVKKLLHEILHVLANKLVENAWVFEGSNEPLMYKEQVNLCMEALKMYEAVQQYAGFTEGEYNDINVDMAKACAQLAASHAELMDLYNSYEYYKLAKELDENVAIEKHEVAHHLRMSYLIAAEISFNKGDYLEVIAIYTNMENDDYVCCTDESDGVYEKFGKAYLLEGEFANALQLLTSAKVQNIRKTVEEAHTIAGIIIKCRSSLESEDGSLLLGEIEIQE